MRWASLILIAVVILPYACSAEEYLPLQIGNRWEYTSSEGDETKEVTWTFGLWGEEVYVISHPESVHNLGLENYWTTSIEGDVFVGGSGLRTRVGDFFTLHLSPSLMPHCI